MRNASVFTCVGQSRTHLLKPVRFAACAAALYAGSIDAQSAKLEVSVTPLASSAGTAPGFAGFTVCAGTTADRSAYGQEVTSATGVVHEAFETIAEALAAGIAAQDEALAFDPYSYERGWVMVEDAAREVVLDATADQVEAVKLGMQDAAGLLAFRAAQEARWAAEAAETRRVLALSADLDAEIPF